MNQVFIPTIKIDGDQELKRGVSFGLLCGGAALFFVGLGAIFSDALDSYVPLVIGAALASLFVVVGLIAVFAILTVGLRAQVRVVERAQRQKHSLDVIAAKRDARVVQIRESGEVALQLQRAGGRQGGNIVVKKGGIPVGILEPAQNREPGDPAGTVRTAAGELVRLDVLDAIVRVWSAVPPVGSTENPFGNRKPYSRERVGEYLRASGKGMDTNDYKPAVDALTAYGPTDQFAARQAYLALKYGTPPPATKALEN